MDLCIVLKRLRKAFDFAHFETQAMNVRVILVIGN